MNTVLLLLAQYQRAVVPLDTVATDYFSISPEKLARKIALGQIRLPVVRMSDSAKSARGVHVTDLAAYIDRARADALK